MKKRYLGITIGPIIETMSYTSTPAGLWTASYFFSSITRNLYIELKAKGYKILTVPENMECEVKGIGQYHDRIYAVTPEGKSDFDVTEEAKRVIESVIKKRAEEISHAISEDKQIDLNNIIKRLHSYLQIHFILQYVEDTQVLAKAMAEALDSLENCQSTVGNLSNNDLVCMLTGKRDNANCYIKKYEPFKDAVMLHKKNNGEQIKDLHDIACCGIPSAKLNKYFAVIQADGDGMGKIVNADLTEQTNNQVGLDDQEKRIRMFSELCMKYTAEASKLIQTYNGVVIYAGGDDLLFLAPIIGETGNIWTLCKEIGNKFNSIFNPAYNKEAGNIVKENQVPSISFGVSVNYYKFPLYEAFEDARNLLFGTAKNFGDKNNLAISVHKASGQTSGYVCRMETKVMSDSKIFETLIDYIELLTQSDGKNVQENNQMLHSLLYHIENKRELFKLAISDENKRNKFFENVFDSIMQKNHKNYIDRIKELTGQIVNVVKNEDKKISTLTEENADAAEEAVNVLTNILRTSKILVEEGV